MCHGQSRTPVPTILGYPNILMRTLLKTASFLCSKLLKVTLYLGNVLDLLLVQIIVYRHHCGRRLAVLPSVSLDELYYLAVKHVNVVKLFLSNGVKSLGEAGMLVSCHNSFLGIP